MFHDQIAAFMHGLPWFACLPLFLVTGSVTWFCLFAFEGAINGAAANGKGWARECVTQDVLWYLPGGLKRRAEYIKTMVSHGDGLVGGYWYHEIKERGLYEEVAKEVLGSGWYFWSMTAFCFISGPVFFLVSVMAFLVYFVFCILLLTFAAFRFLYGASSSADA